MRCKVKVVEATSPYDLELKVNEAIEDPEFKGFEVADIKTVTTFMPGAKVSRGGIFYLTTIVFKKDTLRNLSDGMKWSPPRGGVD